MLTCPVRENRGQFGKLTPIRPRRALAMLNIHGAGRRLCDGLTRCEVPRVGGLGAFGLALPRLLRRQARDQGGLRNRSPVR